MMPLFIHKRLMVFLLVVAVILVPFHSLAHYVTSDAAEGTCACQMVTADGSVNNSGQQPDQCPGNNDGDCCDSEECGQEATEPPFACDLKVNSSVKQRFSTDSHNHIPTVYFAIFVPPER
jgi:hypothetical protein